MQFKFLKKIIGILGYKLVDKNLVKNNRLIDKNNFFSINTILEEIFKSQKINQLIQIGANDGKRFDEINKYIKKYSPHCVLVEPIQLYFKQLKENYKNHKNIIFEKLAISVDDEIQYLFKVKESKLKYYDEHIKGITSFDKRHLEKHGVNSSHIEKENVESITIVELINKYEKKVDLLIIDAEGYDGKIVLDLLQKSEKFPIIIFEFIHIKNQIFENLIDQLKKKYSIYVLNENLICIPKEKKIKLSIDIN